MEKKKGNGGIQRPVNNVVGGLHRPCRQWPAKRQPSSDAQRTNAALARQISDLREEAGLTQRELAELAGTTASVICRLEDANYGGHSLAMLRRIAAVLRKRVEVRFLPARRST